MLGKAEAKVSDRYRQSEELLRAARELIPLGAQTFSKSYLQLPPGASPYFLQRGEGCQVWDVDENVYTDFISGLLAVSLGYQDPDVDAAVSRQLRSGVSFSLSHPLELAVARRLIAMVPCAEQVRFGKNGSDVTAAAIRLARAHSGRERVAVCGYHGWHDWYIGSTSRDLGVPAATKRLTHRFVYNDLDSVRELFAAYPGEFAALIMEPMALEWPEEGFLTGVRDLTREHGTLLIFDEMITGFRFARGGAQEYFDVTPDLATFGKGLANGHPLSAISGPEEIMAGMEEIFFSGTFGGETLSLAAAEAVLTKIAEQPVLETIHHLGAQLIEQTQARIASARLDEEMLVKGHPAWSAIQFQDGASWDAAELRTYFLQELLARGILSIGSHNLSYAHDAAALEHLLSVYDEVFPLLRAALDAGDVRERLASSPIEPLFQVRPLNRESHEDS